MTPKRRRLSIATLATTVLAGFSVDLGSLKAQPSSVTAPAPSASSNTTPLDALPVLLGKDLPEAASPAPRDADWASARTVRPHRGAPGPCTFRNAREWLEIRCGGLVALGLVAGDPKGVTVRVTGQYPNVVARAVLPIRRGEAKVLGFLEEVPEYSSSSFGEAGTLSVLWRANRPDPLLIASGFVPSER